MNFFEVPDLNSRMLPRRAERVSNILLALGMQGVKRAGIHTFQENLDSPIKGSALEFIIRTAKQNGIVLVPLITKKLEDRRIEIQRDLNDDRVLLDSEKRKAAIDRGLTLIDLIRATADSTLKREKLAHYFSTNPIHDG